MWLSSLWLRSIQFHIICHFTSESSSIIPSINVFALVLTKTHIYFCWKVVGRMWIINKMDLNGICWSEKVASKHFAFISVVCTPRASPVSNEIHFSKTFFHVEIIEENKNFAPTRSQLLSTRPLECLLNISRKIATKFQRFVILFDLENERRPSSICLIWMHSEPILLGLWLWFLSR